MFRIKVVAMMLVVAMSAVTGAASAADASLKEVYLAANAGRLQEAQNMMTQVLRDHPNSAKAHYVEAEILVRNGQLNEATEQLNIARKISPSLSFAKPESVRALEERLGAAQGATSGSKIITSQLAHRPSIMSVVLVAGGLCFLIVIISRAMRRPVSVSNGVAQGLYGSYGGAGMNSAPMGTPISGGGSGILGSLATGAALGAGVVAGESLMHRMFNSGGDEQTQFVSAEPTRRIDSYDDTDFGVADNGTWDDSSIASGDDWS